MIKQLCNTTRHVNKCKRPAPKTKLSKSETGEYKCTCESTFAFASYLKRHSKTREKEQLACEKCGKTDSRKDHFEKHVFSCTEIIPTMSFSASNIDT